MRDIIGMQIRHGRQHGGNNPGGFFFSIGIPTVQISAGTHFHHNKNLLLAIKGFDRPDDLRMVERFKDGNFIFKFLHKRRIENPIQMDGFHRIQIITTIPAPAAPGAAPSPFFLTFVH